VSQDTTPSLTEDRISQVPALQVLQNLGYTYLTPQEALELRGGRMSNVILDGILTEQLRRINRIESRGETHAFSEGNIQTAIQALKSEPFDGLIRTNEKLYDLLTLPKSLQQSIYGDTKSSDFWYIDWAHPENNAFHVTEEFAVERTGSHETRRPDLVLFVNGIPLAVIECKSPGLKDPIEQAVSQHIRNQKLDEIPHLFVYAQLLVALSKNEARYATVGTQAKFWSVWKEDVDEGALRELVNRPLSEVQSGKLFGAGELHEDSGAYFTSLQEAGEREVTPQDRALFALCRPERLLELTRRFVLFDAGEKKIARYQQYFTVKAILRRIGIGDELVRVPRSRGSGSDASASVSVAPRHPGAEASGELPPEGGTQAGNDHPRRGGVVWHTQGSGKSLTMVFLAKSLAMERELDDHKVVIVTDRVDLDDQILKTFRQTGHEVIQARSGWNLGNLLESSKAQIITTIIDKFEAAVGKAGVCNESPNIFVLVDESHRSQYGPRHAKMRKALPNACTIGFTGTPLMRKEKSTAVQFGGIIEPSYTIQQAVEDQAVVPLLYEGRHVPQDVDAVPLDTWFEKYTEGLTPEQRADLKKRCSGTSQLQKSKQTVMRIAWDVGTHYRDTWQGTPYKGQLVTMSKASALRYKEFLDEFGMVSSEVLISGPDDREGNEDVFDQNRDEVIRFWQKMMAKYGSEKEYNRQIINAFKNSDQPEIVIVVDKLLTGFDAPRNTVLYLHKPIEGHSLLQAIARVNRLYEGKDFGYIIDYYGVLGKLDEALNLYGGLPDALADFDDEDVANALADVSKEVGQLAQRHSDLWDVFKGIGNRHDEEAFELHLADEALRQRFYERLSAFARTLQVALSSVRFYETTPEARVARYRDDLKFLCNLRTAVRRRYAEAVDFREYERRIQKLIDAHVGTREVEKLTALVNIFDADAFEQEVERVQGTASKADMIAHRTKRTLKEKWEREDPAFFKKFSTLIEEAIEAFHQHRLSDTEYLKLVTEALHHVQNRTGDEIPDTLRSRPVAVAFFGTMEERLARHEREGLDLVALRTEASLKIDDIIRELRIVNWENNTDVQNRMRNAIEDYLFELKDEHGMDLSFDDIDDIMEKCLEIAKVRYPS
jgi:type I restriction enzyme R subunit